MGKGSHAKTEKKKKKVLKQGKQGFPGGVENSPASAGDKGLISGLRKIPQALEQPSPYTTATEPRPGESQQEEPLQ